MIPSSLAEGQSFTAVCPCTRIAVRWDNAAFQVYRDPERGYMPVIFQDPPIVDLEAGNVVFLDPRVIVFNESAGTVDYSPRYYQDQPAWVMGWLKIHPHWGVPGCELDWEKAWSGLD
jgi:hypothetical protein